MWEHSKEYFKSYLYESNKYRTSMLRRTGVIWAAAQFLFWYVCTHFMYIQDNLVLRAIAATLVCLNSFLLPKEGEPTLFQFIYMEVVAAINLPVLFAVLLVVNDINFYWIASMVAGAGLYAIVSHPVIAVTLYPLIFQGIVEWKLHDNPHLSEQRFCLLAALFLLLAVIWLRHDQVKQLERSLELEKQAKFQEALRLESESRLQIAAEAAHGLNNPLNYIEGSLSSFSTIHGALELSIEQLFLDVTEEDQEAFFVKLSLQSHFRNLDPPMKEARQGLDRAIHSVQKIRALSGIDGYSWTDIDPKVLMNYVSQQLRETLPSHLWERLELDWRGEKDSRCFGNQYMICQILQTLAHTYLNETENKIAFSLSGDSFRQNLIIDIVSDAKLPVEKLKHITLQFTRLAKLFGRTAEFLCEESRLRITL